MNPDEIILWIFLLLLLLVSCDYLSGDATEMEDNLRDYYQIRIHFSLDLIGLFMVRHTCKVNIRLIYKFEDWRLKTKFKDSW